MQASEGGCLDIVKELLRAQAGVDLQDEVFAVNITTLVAEILSRGVWMTVWGGVCEGADKKYTPFNLLLHWLQVTLYSWDHTALTNEQWIGVRDNSIVCSSKPT